MNTPICSAKNLLIYCMGWRNRNVCFCASMFMFVCWQFGNDYLCSVKAMDDEKDIFTFTFGHAFGNICRM